MLSEMKEIRSQLEKFKEQASLGEARSFLTSAKAVSYTHLDVYKRQAAAVAAVTAAAEGAAVSTATAAEDQDNDQDQPQAVIIVIAHCLVHLTCHALH